MNADSLFTASKAIALGEAELAAALPGGTDEQIKRAVDRVTKKRQELASAIHVLDHVLGHVRSPDKACHCSAEEIRAAYEND